MSSRRLPGKVLLDLGGQPMLAWVVGRVARARRLDQVVVATSTDPTDDPLVEFCAGRGIACSRGSLNDVLDRFREAARRFEADRVVRITADCPLIDPGLIDELVDALPGNDFVANRLPPPWGRTYPVGVDAEACTREGLETIWKEATLPHQREHVMPFFYENTGRFRVRCLNYPENLGHLRWTVDLPQDLEVLRRVVGHFGGRQDFTWLEVLDLYRRIPELGAANAGIHQKDYRQS